MSNKKTEKLDSVVIRFAGDSGDGMQLMGDRFTNTAALVGNDLGTFPDFPAEIRAPAGSLAGVSAFQLQFSSKDIFTPGDKLDVLVAMNPAALKMHIEDLKSDDYGYCASCGIEIGIRRLEARPTATRCIDCKTIEKIHERQQYG